MEDFITALVNEADYWHNENIGYYMIRDSVESFAIALKETFKGKCECYYKGISQDPCDWIPAKFENGLYVKGKYGIVGPILKVSCNPDKPEIIILSHKDVSVEITGNLLYEMAKIVDEQLNRIKLVIE